MIQKSKNLKNSQTVTRIAVRVKPNSQRNQFLGFNHQRQTFEIALNASARDGEANAELIEFLHQHLRISKSKLKIVAGFKSRDKVLEIECGTIINFLGDAECNNKV